MNELSRMVMSNINDEVLPNPFLLCMAMLLGVERQFAGVQGTMGSQIASSVPLWVVGYIGEYTKDSLFPLKGYGLADAIRRGLDLLSGEYHVRPTGTSSGSKSVLSNRNRNTEIALRKQGKFNSRCFEKRGSALHF